MLFQSLLFIFNFSFQLDVFKKNLKFCEVSFFNRPSDFVGKSNVAAVPKMMCRQLQ